jgi:hypothetical protein
MLNTGDPGHNVKELEPVAGLKNVVQCDEGHRFYLMLESWY